VVIFRPDQQLLPFQSYCMLTRLQNNTKPQSTLNYMQWHYPLTIKRKKQNQKALDGCNMGNTPSTGTVCSTCPRDLLMNPFHFYLPRTSPQNTVIKIKILPPWTN